MKKIRWGVLILLVSVSFFTEKNNAENQKTTYPSDWWRNVPESEKEPWEILPQEAGPGEVILSKRTELGVFSNLAHTPFVLDGRTYASVEALWQSLKFPEENDVNDPRLAVAWPMKRSEVFALHGFEAKRAGDRANELMKVLKIDWVSYQSTRMRYKDGASGSEMHAALLRRAMQAKLSDHPEVRALLQRTQGLVLRPDHKVPATDPPAYQYHKIYMEFRDTILK